MLKSISVLLFSLSLFKFSSAYPTSEISDSLIDEVNADEAGDYFEGDMILNPEQVFHRLNPGARNGRIDEKYRWNNAEVYIEFDKVFDEEHINYVWKALKNIEEVTCIRFLPKNNESQDYVYVTGEKTGCHTIVGRKGKMQKLNLAVNDLGNKCFKMGTITHEFIHALGFYHQQSSSNRNTYVKVEEENIKDGKLPNFKKETTSTDFRLPYDYDSIMHYSRKAFSKNGKDTIIPIEKSAEIGQRTHLSEIDIKKLNLMYKCAGSI